MGTENHGRQDQRHEPADRWQALRLGTAPRRARPAALLARDSQRPKGHYIARGTRSGVRRLVHQHSRAAAIRIGLCGHQSQLEDPRAAGLFGYSHHHHHRGRGQGPPRPAPGMGIRVHFALPGRTRGKILADRPSQAHRVHELAHVANGHRSVSRRRIRTLLQVRSPQGRIRDRPVRHGDQADRRRPRTTPGGQGVRVRRRVHDCRHGDFPLDAVPRQGVQRVRVSATRNLHQCAAVEGNPRSKGGRSERTPRERIRARQGP
mmetsp:Transcript_9583/g.28615  ORF Transcript_9583/g.28615 Transcript_9583/m.28615 type:complete len:262 (+) Transcript_9583:261-1046(+)